MGRWVPFVKTPEGADGSLGLEVKRHMIFSYIYKFNRRVEVGTERVFGVLEKYYNKWNLQTKEEINKFNSNFWKQGGIKKGKV